MVRSSSIGLTPRPTDNAPCGSKSTSRTRRPYSDRAAPRLMVVVVLPTPPFWLHSASTRAGPCRSSGRGSTSRGNGRPVGPTFWARLIVDIAFGRFLVLAPPRHLDLQTGREVGDSSGGAARAATGWPNWCASPPRSRMCRRGDPAQPPHGDQPVELRRGHRRVAEQLLHDPYVRPAVEQVRRERVAQRVWAHRGGDPGTAGRGAKHGPRALARQATAAVVHEQRRCAA